METILAEVNAVAGVQGSLFFNRLGEVLAGSAPPGLDTTALPGIGRQVTQSLAALEAAGEPQGELDIRYEGARLLARNLGTAVLAVLCKPEVGIALLRLTLNVVTARAKNDRGIQSQLLARAAGRDLNQDDMDELSWQLLKILREGR